MSQTAKVEPFDYMHGNTLIHAFSITVNGRTLPPFKTRDEALSFAQSQGYVVENE